MKDVTKIASREFYYIGNHYDKPYNVQFLFSKDDLIMNWGRPLTGKVIDRCVYRETCGHYIPVYLCNLDHLKSLVYLSESEISRRIQ